MFTTTDHTHISRKRLEIFPIYVIMLAHRVVMGESHLSRQALRKLDIDSSNAPSITMISFWIRQLGEPVYNCERVQQEMDIRWSVMVSAYVRIFPAPTNYKTKCEFRYMIRTDKESWYGIKQDAWTEHLCETSQYQKYSHGDEAWSATKSEEKRLIHSSEMITVIFPNQGTPFINRD